MPYKAFKLVSALSILSSLVVSAHAQYFTPLGKTADEIYISSNGLTVAGNNSNNMNGPSAWAWSTATQTFWPITVSNVFCLSGDGLSAAGNDNNNSQNFYYKLGISQPINPSLVPETFSFNGKLLYGYQGSGRPDAYFNAGTNTTTAFLQTNYSDYPWICSFDGNSVYGYESGNGVIKSWLATPSGLTYIGSFRVYGCSSDGTSAVGVDSNTVNTIDYYSTSSGITTRQLPGAPYTMEDMPLALSADGKKVWGTYIDGAGLKHAYIWSTSGFLDLGANTAFINERGQRGGNRFPGLWKDSSGTTHGGYYEFGGAGWVDIRAALVNTGQSVSNWSFLELKSISDDGNAMCGEGTDSGQTQAFYVQKLRPLQVKCGTNPTKPNTTLEGELVLSGKAGASGQVVALTSSNSAVTVPSSLSVSAGLNYIYFPIHIAQNAFAGKAIIKAVLGSYSTYLIEQIQSPFANFTTSSSSVTNGHTIYGIIVLPQNAGSGGVTVSVKSNSTAVSFNSTETVPAGKDYLYFPVTAHTTQTVNVTLTATLNGTSVTTSFVVNPPG